jgi:hypothetical protein
MVKATKHGTPLLMKFIDHMFLHEWDEDGYGGGKIKNLKVNFWQSAGLFKK